MAARHARARIVTASVAAVAETLADLHVI